MQDPETPIRVNISAVSFLVRLMWDIDQLTCWPKNEMTYLITFWNFYGALAGLRNQTELAESNSKAKVAVVDQRDAAAISKPSLIARILAMITDSASTGSAKCNRITPWWSLNTRHGSRWIRAINTDFNGAMSSGKPWNIWADMPQMGSQRHTSWRTTNFGHQRNTPTPCDPRPSPHIMKRKIRNYKT